MLTYDQQVFLTQNNGARGSENKNNGIQLEKFMVKLIQISLKVEALRKILILIES